MKSKIKIGIPAFFVSLVMMLGTAAHVGAQAASRFWARSLPSTELRSRSRRMPEKCMKLKFPPQPR